MLHLYNTLTRKKEKFVSLQKGIVKIYSCGPTVYDYAHIGNFRAYVFEDLLRRYLKYKGYQVFQVMNITDVDDKTIAGAKKEKIELNSFTQRYIKAFFKDLEKLNIEQAEVYPQATKHIPEMVNLIKILLKEGFAYEKDGSIYFKISRFKDYGKLSQMPISNTERREQADEYDKENPSDFALWKKAKADEPFWQTDIGKGRPGWHIECSAMSMKYLGESFDIHTGGEDNIFPHHENEIAQSEAATGKKFVRYWLHCKFLLVNNEKMAKSKGNFFTLRDLLVKGYNPSAIRFLLLSTHYRSALNFTEQGIKQAEQALKRLQDFYLNINNYKKKGSISFTRRIEETKIGFEKAMDDDLNISQALAGLFNLVKDANIAISKEEICGGDLKEIKNLIEKINTVLGILEFAQLEEIDKNIKELIEQRGLARERKDFKLADEIRKGLKQKGIILEDTKDGGRWKKIS